MKTGQDHTLRIDEKVALILTRTSARLSRRGVFDLLGRFVLRVVRRGNGADIAPC